MYYSPSYGEICESIGSNDNGPDKQQPSQELLHLTSATAPPNLRIAVIVDLGPWSFHVRLSCKEQQKTNDKKSCIKKHKDYELNRRRTIGFELIKAVSDTVLDMINAVYYDKPLIFIRATFQENLISIRQPVNINW